MKVPSNLLSDIIRHYQAKLTVLYPEYESRQMLYWLVEDFFGFTPQHLALNPDLRLSESELLKVHFAIKDLLKYKPLQYITGKAWFYGRIFQVNPHVLIPRQETELLVSKALEFLSHRSEKRVLDMGTGSGCIAISLALECEGSKVMAIEKYLPALELAQSNTAALQAAVEFVQGDLMDVNQKLLTHEFDLIVSNPPYVTESDKQLMRNNVIDWEPEHALFVPDNEPLLFYKPLATFARLHLAKGGMLIVEINERFAEPVKQLLIEQGFSNIRLSMDIHDKARLISAQL